MEICIGHICGCTISYVYSNMFLILKMMYSSSFTVYMHMFIHLNKIFLFVLLMGILDLFRIFYNIWWLVQFAWIPLQYTVQSQVENNIFWTMHMNRHLNMPNDLLEWSYLDEKA